MAIKSALENELAEYRRAWMAISTSCEPIDHARAKKAIRDLYVACGFASPPILFFSSPLVCLLAFCELLGFREEMMPTPLLGPFWDQLDRQLAARADFDPPWRDRKPQYLHSVLGGGLWLTLRDEYWPQDEQRELLLYKEACAQPSQTTHEFANARYISEKRLRRELQMTWRVQAAIALDLREEFLRADRYPHKSQMSHWIYNLVFYESFGGGNACEAEVIHNFARRMGIVFDQEANRQIDLLIEQASTCHWWFPFGEVVLASERPTAIHLDDQGGLHNLTGPALTYADGWELWALRGMVVSKELVQKFDELTACEIANEKNAELRRVLIEVFGLPRFLRESGARKMHDDKWGTLWRMEFAGEEPMVMVELQDSTPRPDGQARTYFLRVPPTVKTPHEAVAWSFHKSPDDYDPEQQT